jgi:hypothetical protein
MTVYSIQRDWGPNVSVVRMITDSSLEDICLTGWLTSQMPSIAEANRGKFEFTPNDVCLISYPQNQNIPYPGGVQSKSWFYVFPSFNSVNPIAPLYRNLQNITANPGGGQANAVPLNLGINVISVVAVANDSVILPTDVLGQTVIVRNNGANNVAVFPNIGDKINGNAINTSVAIVPNASLIFIGVNTVQWATIS